MIQQPARSATLVRGAILFVVLATVASAIVTRVVHRTSEQSEEPSVDAGTLVGSTGIGHAADHASATRRLERIEPWPEKAQAPGRFDLDQLPDDAIRMLANLTWDAQRTAQLEMMLLKHFDLDGDGVLDGYERAEAVAAIRDRVLKAHGQDVGDPTPVDPRAGGALHAASAGAAPLPRLYLTSEESRRFSRASDEWTRNGRFEIATETESKEQVLERLATSVLANFDLDADGVLSPDEQRLFIKKHGSAEPETDLNGDGLVDNDDLVLFVGTVEHLER